MDINGDLVSSNINTKVWKYFDMDFNNLRKVKIYGIETFIPSKKDTKNILKKTYNNYKKKHCDYYDHLFI